MRIEEYRFQNDFAIGEKLVTVWGINDTNVLCAMLAIRSRAGVLESLIIEAVKDSWSPGELIILDMGALRVKCCEARINLRAQLNGGEHSR